MSTTSTSMSEIINSTDFRNFCGQWEEKVLIQVLLKWNLADQNQVKSALQEKNSPLAPASCSLGQILVKNRILTPVNFAKANNIVKQQLVQQYAKQQQQNPTLSISQSDTNQENTGRTASSATLVQPENKNKIFGSYEIIEEIARGGMGIVFKARQMYLNRIVALKVLLSGSAATESEIQRFKREAEAAGSLQHANIVSIYEIGEFNNSHYFTMDFIEGDTLQALIKRKQTTKSKRKLIEILAKVASAMQHAHERNVIHRDIKPSNIIVSKDGEPKVTDFGLAKKLDAETMLTETGSALGTPFYMSPEQTTGDKVIDGRSDIYSLGVILYEVLTGQYPFNGSTLVELYHKIVNDDAIPPRKINKKGEKDLEIICMKCMEKSAERRYQSAQELANDLDNFLNGDAISARRSSPLYRWGRKIKRNRRIIATSIWGLLTLGAFIWLLFFSYWDTELYKIPSEERPMYLKAKDYMKKGRNLIREHKLEDAIKLFEDAIKTYPKYKEAYISIGDIYQVYKDYQKALDEYSRVLKIDPEYAPAYFRKGHSYMGLKNWDKAIDEFTKAIEYDPKYVEAYKDRSLAYRNRGDQNQDSSDYEKSIKDYEKAKESE